MRKITNLGEKLYKHWILDRGKGLIFLSFVFFAATIINCRLLVIWIGNNRPILNFFRISDYHIHHFYLGILLLVVSTWLLLFKNNREKYVREIKISASVLFGIGLGLIVDEFGLLLTMEVDIKGGYFTPYSYYLMAIVSSIFLLSLILPNKKRPARRRP